MPRLAADFTDAVVRLFPLARGSIGTCNQELSCGGLNFAKLPSVIVSGIDRVSRPDPPVATEPETISLKMGTTRPYSGRGRYVTDIQLIPCRCWIATVLGDGRVDDDFGLQGTVHGACGGDFS